MLIGVFIKDDRKRGDRRLGDLLKTLEAGGCTCYDVKTAEDIRPGTEMLLGIGGDGTFLSALKRVGDSGIPILGVNLGRLGFLSENDPDQVAAALLSGEYEIEDRGILKASVSGNNFNGGESFSPYALNEVTVHRRGAAVLGINVNIDGEKLPTYWADGLIVATSSGSTAYSLSAGGPICMPQAKVLIISPIAPHNLNVRPLVVPDNVNISISMISRDKDVVMTVDNRTVVIDASCHLDVAMAQFSLKRVRLSRSNFVKALTSKLFWGEDIRNNVE